MRTEEPQSHREVGMLRSEMGDLQGAWDNLWHVVETDWALRFQHIEDEVHEPQQPTGYDTRAPTPDRLPSILVAATLNLTSDDRDASVSALAH